MPETSDDENYTQKGHQDCQEDLGSLHHRRLFFAGRLEFICAVNGMKVAPERSVDQKCTNENFSPTDSRPFRRFGMLGSTDFTYSDQNQVCGKPEKPRLPEQIPNVKRISSRPAAQCGNEEPSPH